MKNKIYYFKLMLAMVIFGNLPIKEAIRCFKEIDKNLPTPCRTVEYDEKKIEEAKIKFAQKKLQDIIVCLDLDNTTVKYSVGRNDCVSLMLQMYKGFYANLGRMKGTILAIILFKELEIRYRFPTAALTNEYCRPEKLINLKKKLGPLFSENQVIFIDPGKDKAETLKDLGYDINNCVLVDDYWKNLVSWLEQGGFSIKKTYSGKERPIPTAKTVVDVVRILLDTCDITDNKKAQIIRKILN